MHIATQVATLKSSRKLLRRSLNILLRKSRILRYPNEPSDIYEAYCNFIKRLDNLEAILKPIYTIKKRLSAIAITLEKREEETSKALAIMEKLEKRNR